MACQLGSQAVLPRFGRDLVATPLQPQAVEFPARGLQRSLRLPEQAGPRRGAQLLGSGLVDADDHDGVPFLRRASTWRLAPAISENGRRVRRGHRRRRDRGQRNLALLAMRRHCDPDHSSPLYHDFVGRGRVHLCRSDRLPGRHRPELFGTRFCLGRGRVGGTSAPHRKASGAPHQDSANRLWKDQVGAGSLPRRLPTWPRLRGSGLLCRHDPLPLQRKRRVCSSGSLWRQPGLQLHRWAGDRPTHCAEADELRYRPMDAGDSRLPRDG
mmetsp:Transcript_29783/g.70228  ORF Transcript_29783/g.70228 Transcript_29783/m.70228 type:complete len:269 (+) Transcript_29783:433-1239(+)